MGIKFYTIRFKDQTLFLFIFRVLRVPVVLRGRTRGGASASRQYDDNLYCRRPWSVQREGKWRRRRRRVNKNEWRKQLGYLKRSGGDRPLPTLSPNNHKTSIAIQTAWKWVRRLAPLRVTQHRMESSQPLRQSITPLRHIKLLFQDNAIDVF
jgi:hypothetical protein